MTIYYVRPTNGSDAAAGTSFATAFKSTQKALDAAIAGDTVRLIPESSEVITAKIDVDINAGTSINYIVIETGNTVDGSRDITLTYTITTSTALASVLDIAAFGYYRFYNIFFDANSVATTPVYNGADGADGITFINCRMSNGTGNGFSIRGSSASFPWLLVNCEIDGNQGLGIDHAAANRGVIHLYNSIVHDNVSHGWGVNRTSCYATNCEFYKNGGSGISMNSNSSYMQLHDVTIYGNTSDGVTLYNATSRIGYVIKGCTMSGNGGYGIKFSSGNSNTVRYFDYNHTYNNTSGASDLTLPGDNNQTGDPQFTNTGAGTEDFTPANGSPLDGTGLYGKDIGARKAVDPAGGGGSGICKLVGSGGLAG